MHRHSILVADSGLFSWLATALEDPFVVRVLVIVFALAMIIFPFVIYHRVGIKKEWRKAAASLNLPYLPPAFLFLHHLIEGSYGGHKVKVFVHRHKQGKGTKFYTEYECPLASPWDCGVLIGSRGKWLMKGFVPVLSRSEILEVGAPRFDDAFYVAGTLPEEIREILHDPELIDKMRELTTHYRHVEILDGKVRFRHRRIVRDAEKICAALDRLVDLTTELNEALR